VNIPPDPGGLKHIQDQHKQHLPDAVPVLEVIVHKKVNEVEEKFYDVFIEAERNETSYLEPVHGSITEVRAADVDEIEVEGRKNIRSKNTQKFQALEDDVA
jgi:hypothetical protein